MDKTNALLASHAIVGLLFIAIAPVQGASNVCSASYVVDEVKGEETIDQFGTNYQAVNVFSYDFNGECRIVAKSPWVEQVAQKIRNDPKRLVLIDLVNEIELTTGPCRNLSPGQIVQQILSDPTQRANHIRELVAISALGQGIEIDYEHVLAESTPLITSFMRDLRAALPSEKKLAMVVQPKTQGGGEQGKTIDWRGVEPYVDYLRVMAYYYSFNTSPPGPVITYAKLGQLADYILTNATQSIPRAKARILLSLYGWDWPISPKGPGNLIRYEQAMAIAQSHGVTPQRDPAEDTLHFQYTDDVGTVHEIWFNDAQAEEKRVQLLLDKNFPAIDFWHLNTGDPALWSWFTPMVRSDCPSLVAPAGTPAAAVIQSVSPNAFKIGGGNTTVTITGTNFTASDIVLVSGNPVFPTAVSGTTIQISLPAGLFESAKTIHVAVSQNARLSNTLSLYVVGNPVIDSFNPASASAGWPAFTLVVRGRGFEPASTVRFGVTDLVTQFVSDSELRATVSSAAVANPGTVRIGIVNPTSDGRISRDYTINPADSAPPPPPPPPPDEETPLPAPAPPLRSFAVGPNPWTAGKTTGGIRFFGLSDNELKIFTMDGRFVKTLRPLNQTAEWDLKTDDGDNVASGYYLYLGTDANGSQQKGTVAVVR